MAVFRKTVVALQGLYDGVNRAYSDSNPPYTLMRTFQTTEPAAPPATLVEEWSPDGKSLYQKAPDGTVTKIGPSAGGGGGTAVAVSAFTAAGATPSDTDVVGGTVSGSTRKISFAQIWAYIASRAGVNNAAVASTAAGFAADTYLVGSNCSVPTGKLKAQSMYRLKFKVTKTAAGTATPIITVRYGTAATTADTARVVLTFAAQTAVVDSGFFEVFCTFRTVGSGTNAVLHAIGTLGHVLAATGLSTANMSIADTVSAGFDSTPAGSVIGVSVNGGTSAAWTISMVQAELFNFA